MKKNFVLFFLLVILLIGKSFGQGACADADTLKSFNTLQEYYMNSNEYWLTFKADSSLFELTILPPSHVNAINISKIYLFKGNCNNLTLIDTMNLEMNLLYKQLQTGNNYFIQVKQTTTNNGYFSLLTYNNLKSNSTPLQPCSPPLCQINPNGDFEITTTELDSILTISNTNNPLIYNSSIINQSLYDSEYWYLFYPTNYTSCCNWFACPGGGVKIARDFVNISHKNHLFLSSGGYYGTGAAAFTKLKGTSIAGGGIGILQDVPYNLYVDYKLNDSLWKVDSTNHNSNYYPGSSGFSVYLAKDTDYDIGYNAGYNCDYAAGKGFFIGRVYNNGYYGWQTASIQLPSNFGINNINDYNTLLFINEYDSTRTGFQQVRIDNVVLSPTISHLGNFAQINCPGNPFFITENAKFTNIVNWAWSWSASSGNMVTQIDSLHNSTISTITNVTTEYSVNATDQNGCHYKDTVDVNFFPLSHPPTILGGNNNCDKTSVYTASNYDGSNYFFWNIVNGTYTNMGNSIKAVWSDSITNDNPSKVILIYRDANYCKSQADTLLIYKCCNYDSTIVNIHDKTITSSSQIPSGIFFLNGTLTIDTNIIFNQNNILMGPQANIIINPNHTLTIDQYSILSAGCKYMWDGIYVNNGLSEIDVKGNSIIKDAVNGLVSVNDGIIKLDSANLLDNYNNVKIINSIISPYPGYIKSTTISGISQLSYPPYQGIKTYSGVYCDSVLDLTIGDYTLVDYKNVFNTMQYGILAMKSNINVFNNEFDSIFTVPSFIGYGPSWNHNSPIPVNLHPIPIFKYYPDGAIYAVHNSYNYSNTLIVGDNDNLKRNYFNNCATGIHTYNYNEFITNNNFTDCKIGISLLNPNYGSIIYNNHIDQSSYQTVNRGTGILVQNTYTVPTKITIRGNTINHQRNGLSLISLESDNSHSNGRNVIIDSNKVNYLFPHFPSPDNISHGIYVAVTDTITGIQIHNCDQILINQNIINRNMPVLGAESNTIRGIWTSESKGANILQNAMIHMGSGILTTGQLINTQYNCNSLDNDFFGIQFGFNSYISDQGRPNGYNPANYWNDCSDNSALRIYGGAGTLDTSFTYYFNPNAGSNYVVSPAQMITNKTIYLVPNPGDSTYCNYSGIGLLPFGGSITSASARDAALLQIVRDKIYYGALQDEYKIKAMEYAYKLLASNPSLINMGGTDDNLYLQFYNEVQQSAIAKTLDERRAMYDHDLDLAKHKLSQIADINTINHNRIIVDNIYLNTWAQDIYDLTDDQTSTLFEIAIQAPYAAGDAVYTARVMLNINPADFALDYVKPPHKVPQVLKENTVKVYPNPAKMQFTLEFNDVISSNANIQIYGIMGNLVLNDYMPQGNYTKNIDVSKLKSGFYFYRIIINGTIVSSGKITILNK